MDFWHEFIKNTIHGKNALYLKREMQGPRTKRERETERMSEKKRSV